MTIGRVCGSRKYPYQPHGRSLKFQGGGVPVSQLPKFWGGKYKALLEIQGEREGSNENTFHGGGMDISWNSTICDGQLPTISVKSS